PLAAHATASRRGTVTDPPGAVVPGAEVKLTTEATGFSRPATAGSDGVYNFAQVAPGTYKFEATAQGFKTHVREHLAIQVGVASTLSVQLDVGAVTEVVEVTAATAALNTTDASIGNTFHENQIRQLPIEARNVVHLLSLQPGAVYVPSGDIRSGSISGSKSDQTNVTLDGVDVNDNQFGYSYTAVLRVTQDSVQEFRVTTSNYDATEGRSSAAQVKLITKSWSNELHGSAYYYHRNTATSANEYFLKLGQARAGRPSEAPKLNKHIFGASAGGPIIKDRFFIFGNFEGLKLLRESPVLRAVPSASFRDGVLIYRCVNRTGSPACPTTTTTATGFASTHTVPAGHFGLGPTQLASLDPLGIG
ncbi:MAG: carboxypeptidase-like regulatory domain-containing protein, partial [Chloroflexota bacterium]